MEVQPGELMEGRWGGGGPALSTLKTHMHPTPQLSLLMMTPPRLHPSQTDPPPPRLL